MNDSFSILLLSTISIAFLHTLAPDHWVPFAMIGQAQKWSDKKLLAITFVSGIGHVLSSIILGAIGIAAGIGLSRLEKTESNRAQIAGLLIIGFGIAYAVWGLKRLKEGRDHSHMMDHQKATTIWTLIAIFLLGPCEPLIPLMFMAVKYGRDGITTITLSFSIVTVAMMILQAYLSFRGVKLIKAEAWAKYTHIFAGIIIAATGAAVMLLEI
jgi:sulfite exporter TauE/SafE